MVIFLLYPFVKYHHDGGTSAAALIMECTVIAELWKSGMQPWKGHETWILGQEHSHCSRIVLQIWGYNGTHTMCCPPVRNWFNKAMTSIDISTISPIAIGLQTNLAILRAPPCMHDNPDVLRFVDA